MDGSWRWAGARSVGTSHIRSGDRCQDFAACLELLSVSGNVFAAIISDGAGSASHAEAGSRMVCVGFLRAIRAYFSAGGAIEDIDDETVLDWTDQIRERINIYASRQNLEPRNCAATLVAVLADHNQAIVLHVGDGAAVVRELGSSEWSVPSWPFQGEYASMTRFITDDPSPRIEIRRLYVQLDAIALFSDGLERMVLDHARRSAFTPFFERMTAPLLASSASGHDKNLSGALRSYLGSPTVCDRTDDDKSLIIGVRR